MKNFLKQIFTWWHKQTVGTFLYTIFTGKLSGKDQFGNKYYSNSKGKRWVIYKSNIESSKIPAEWHLWIHFLTRNTPTENIKKFSWQKQHQENLTGTKNAHKPDGSLFTDLKKNMKKYETWKF
jgi:NADH:ubiquinone oxidoreductase subunit